MRAPRPTRILLLALLALLTPLAGARPGVAEGALAWILCEVCPCGACGEAAPEGAASGCCSQPAAPSDARWSAEQGACPCMTPSDGGAAPIPHFAARAFESSNQEPSLAPPSAAAVQLLAAPPPRSLALRGPPGASALSSCWMRYRLLDRGAPGVLAALCCALL